MSVLTGAGISETSAFVYGMSLTAGGWDNFSAAVAGRTDAVAAIKGLAERAETTGLTPQSAVTVVIGALANGLTLGGAKDKNSVTTRINNLLSKDTTNAGNKLMSVLAGAEIGKSNAFVYGMSLTAGEWDNFGKAVAGKIDAVATIRKVAAGGRLTIKEATYIVISALTSGVSVMDLNNKADLLKTTPIVSDMMKAMQAEGRSVTEKDAVRAVLTSGNVIQVGDNSYIIQAGNTTLSRIHGKTLTTELANTLSSASKKEIRSFCEGLCERLGIETLGISEDAGANEIAAAVKKAFANAGLKTEDGFYTGVMTRNADGKITGMSGIIAAPDGSGGLMGIMAITAEDGKSGAFIRSEGFTAQGGHDVSLGKPIKIMTGFQLSEDKVTGKDGQATYTFSMESLMIKGAQVTSFYIDKDGNKGKLNAKLVDRIGKFQKHHERVRSMIHATEDGRIVFSGVIRGDQKYEDMKAGEGVAAGKPPVTEVTKHTIMGQNGNVYHLNGEVEYRDGRSLAFARGARSEIGCAESGVPGSKLTYRKGAELVVDKQTGEIRATSGTAYFKGIAGDTVQVGELEYELREDNQAIDFKYNSDIKGLQHEGTAFARYVLEGEKNGCKITVRSEKGEIIDGVLDKTAMTVTEARMEGVINGRTVGKNYAKVAGTDLKITFSDGKYHLNGVIGKVDLVFKTEKPVTPEATPGAEEKQEEAAIVEKVENTVLDVVEVDAKDNSIVRLQGSVDIVDGELGVLMQGAMIENKSGETVSFRGAVLENGFAARIGAEGKMSVWDARLKGEAIFDEGTVARVYGFKETTSFLSRLFGGESEKVWAVVDREDVYTATGLTPFETMWAKGGTLDTILTKEGMGVEGLAGNVKTFAALGAAGGGAAGIAIGVGTSAGLLSIPLGFVGAVIGAASGAVVGLVVTGMQYYSRGFREATYEYTAGHKLMDTMAGWAESDTFMGAVVGGTIFELANMGTIVLNNVTFGIGAGAGGFKLHEKSLFNKRLGSSGWRSRFTLGNLVDLGTTVVLIGVTGGRGLLSLVKKGVLGIGRIGGTVGKIGLQAVKGIPGTVRKGLQKARTFRPGNLAESFRTGKYFALTGKRAKRLGKISGREGIAERYGEKFAAAYAKYSDTFMFKLGGVIGEGGLLSLGGKLGGRLFKTAKTGGIKGVGGALKAGLRGIEGTGVSPIVTFANKTGLAIRIKGVGGALKAGLRGIEGTGVSPIVTFANKTGLAIRIKGVGGAFKAGLRGIKGKGVSPIVTFVNKTGLAVRTVGNRLKGLQARVGAMREAVSASDLVFDMRFAFIGAARAFRHRGIMGSAKYIGRKILTSNAMGTARTSMALSMANYTMVGAVGQTFFAGKDFGEVFNKGELLKWAALGFVSGGVWGGVSRILSAVNVAGLTSGTVAVRLAQAVGTGMQWTRVNVIVYGLTTVLTGKKLSVAEFAKTVVKGLLFGAAFHSIFTAVNTVGKFMQTSRIAKASLKNKILQKTSGVIQTVGGVIKAVGRAWRGKTGIVTGFTGGSLVRDLRAKGEDLSVDNMVKFMKTEEGINSLVRGLAWGVFTAYLVSATGIAHRKGVLGKVKKAEMKGLEKLTTAQETGEVVTLADVMSGKGFNTIARASIEGAKKWPAISVMFTVIGGALESVLHKAAGGEFKLEIADAAGNPVGLFSLKGLGVVTVAAVHGASEGLWMGPMVHMMAAGAAGEAAGKEMGVMAKVAKGRLTAGEGVVLSGMKQVAAFAGQVEMVTKVTLIDKVLSRFAKAPEGARGPKTGFGEKEKNVLTWIYLFIMPQSWSVAGQIGKAVSGAGMKVEAKKVTRQLEKKVESYLAGGEANEAMDLARSKMGEVGVEVEKLELINRAQAELKLDPGKSPADKYALEMAGNKYSQMSRFLHSQGVTYREAFKKHEAAGKTIEASYKELKGEAQRQFNREVSMVDVARFCAEKGFEFTDVVTLATQVKGKGRYEGNIRNLQSKYGLSKENAKTVYRSAVFYEKASKTKRNMVEHAVGAMREVESVLKGQGKEMTMDYDQVKALVYDLSTSLANAKMTAKGITQGMIAFKCGAGKTMPIWTAQLAFLRILKAAGKLSSSTRLMILTDKEGNVTKDMDAKVGEVAAVKEIIGREFKEYNLGVHAVNSVKDMKASTGKGQGGIYFFSSRSLMSVYYDKAGRDLLKGFSKLSIDEFEAVAQSVSLTHGAVDRGAFKQLKKSGGDASFGAIDEITGQAGTEIHKAYYEEVGIRGVDGKKTRGVNVDSKGRQYFENIDGQARLTETYFNELTNNIISKASPELLSRLGGKKAARKLLAAYVNRTSDILTRDIGAGSVELIPVKEGSKKYRGYNIIGENGERMKDTRFSDSLMSLAVTHMAEAKGMKVTAEAAYREFKSSSQGGVNIFQTLDFVDRNNAFAEKGAESITVGYGGTIEGCRQVLGIKGMRVLDLDVTKSSQMGLWHVSDGNGMDEVVGKAVKTHRGREGHLNVVVTLDAYSAKAIGEKAAKKGMRVQNYREGANIEKGAEVVVYETPADYKNAFDKAKSNDTMSEFLRKTHIIGELTTGANVFGTTAKGKVGGVEVTGFTFSTYGISSSSIMMQQAARVNVDIGGMQRRADAGIIDHYVDISEMRISSTELKSLREKMDDGTTGSIDGKKGGENQGLIDAIWKYCENHNSRIDARQLVQVRELKTSEGADLRFDMDPAMLENAQGVAANIVDFADKVGVGTEAWQSMTDNERVTEIEELKGKLSFKNLGEMEQAIFMGAFNADSRMQFFNEPAVFDAVSSIKKLVGGPGWNESEAGDIARVAGALQGRTDTVQNMVIAAFNDTIFDDTSLQDFNVLAEAIDMAGGEVGISVMMAKAGVKGASQIAFIRNNDTLMTNARQRVIEKRVDKLLASVTKLEDVKAAKDLLLKNLAAQGSEVELAPTGTDYMQIKGEKKGRLVTDAKLSHRAKRIMSRAGAPVQIRGMAVYIDKQFDHARIDNKPIRREFVEMVVGTALAEAGLVSAKGPVVVTFVRNSEALFEHKQDGIIVVNSRLLDIVDELRVNLGLNTGQTRQITALMLKMGIAHEIRHEAGVGNSEREEAAMSVVDAITFIKGISQIKGVDTSGLRESMIKAAGKGLFAEALKAISSNDTLVRDIETGAVVPGINIDSSGMVNVKLGGRVDIVKVLNTARVFAETGVSVSAVTEDGINIRSVVNKDNELEAVKATGMTLASGVELDLAKPVLMAAADGVIRETGKSFAKAMNAAVRDIDVRDAASFNNAVERLKTAAEDRDTAISSIRAETAEGLAMEADVLNNNAAVTRTVEGREIRAEMTLDRTGRINTAGMDAVMAVMAEKSNILDAGSMADLVTAVAETGQRTGISLNSVRAEVSRGVSMEAVFDSAGLAGMNVTREGVSIKTGRENADVRSAADALRGEDYRAAPAHLEEAVSSALSAAGTYSHLAKTPVTAEARGLAENMNRMIASGAMGRLEQSVRGISSVVTGAVEMLSRGDYAGAQADLAKAERLIQTAIANNAVTAKDVAGLRSGITGTMEAVFNTRLAEARVIRAGAIADNLGSLGSSVSQMIKSEGFGRLVRSAPGLMSAVTRAVDSIKKGHYAAAEAHMTKAEGLVRQAVADKAVTADTVAGLRTSIAGTMAAVFDAGIKEAMGTAVTKDMADSLRNLSAGMREMINTGVMGRVETVAPGVTAAITRAAGSIKDGDYAAAEAHMAKADGLVRQAVADKAVAADTVAGLRSSIAGTMAVVFDAGIKEAMGAAVTKDMADSLRDLSAGMREMINTGVMRQVENTAPGVAAAMTRAVDSIKEGDYAAAEAHMAKAEGLVRQAVADKAVTADTAAGLSVSIAGTMAAVFDAELAEAKATVTDAMAGALDTLGDSMSRVTKLEGFGRLIMSAPGLMPELTKAVEAINRGNYADARVRLAETKALVKRAIANKKVKTSAVMTELIDGMTGTMAVITAEISDVKKRETRIGRARIEAPALEEKISADSARRTLCLTNDTMLELGLDRPEIDELTEQLSRGEISREDMAKILASRMRTAIDAMAVDTFTVALAGVLIESARYVEAGQVLAFDSTSREVIMAAVDALSRKGQMDILAKEVSRQVGYDAQALDQVKQTLRDITGMPVMMRVLRDVPLEDMLRVMAREVTPDVTKFMPAGVRMGVKGALLSPERARQLLPETPEKKMPVVEKTGPPEGGVQVREIAKEAQPAEVTVKTCSRQELVEKDLKNMLKGVGVMQNGKPDPVVIFADAFIDKGSRHAINKLIVACQRGNKVVILAGDSAAVAQLKSQIENNKGILEVALTENDKNPADIIRGEIGRKYGEDIGKTTIIMSEESGYYDKFVNNATGKWYNLVIAEKGLSFGDLMSAYIASIARGDTYIGLTDAAIRKLNKERKMTGKSKAIRITGTQAGKDTEEDIDESLLANYISDVAF
ncbi:MAG: hypothetical protein U9R44_06645 [Candidatus Omnitrophota bacterium]|nr:hypothetical protein [Candidatus Omnitrophota bacterium]